jgi:Lactate racemase N-terminal domain
MELPKIIRVRQQFTATSPLDIRRTVEAELERLRGRIRPNSRIALGVGSRGITHLVEIVSTILEQLKSMGAIPFIIPAMGSHGGATAEGQLEVLESYGVTEKSMNVPIRASLDVREIGRTADLVPAYCSTEALAADGILLINRIKPHTDFFGTLGSGLLKMCVIGLGKRTGATTMHLAATQWGYEKVIRNMASVIIEHAPILGGIGIIENQFHETARIVAINREEMETAEDELLLEAKSLMPSLPFEEIDLLIIDRIGKNISGAGMDPNIVNRSVHGYNSLPMRDGHSAPFIRRIFVRGLTPETHGNAIGIGMADATTNRLVRDMDLKKTSINSLTALTPQSAKLPIAFASDRDAIETMLLSLPLAEVRDARIVRIADTLSLADMEISEALWHEVKENSKLIAASELSSFRFNEAGDFVF